MGWRTLSYLQNQRLTQSEHSSPGKTHALPIVLTDGLNVSVSDTVNLSSYLQTCKGHFLIIIIVSFMSGDRRIPCGRQGEHGSYFKAVLSFSIESVGILWREPINIYIGEHCRSRHIPKHEELKSVFPSTLSRKSQSKNERCQLHSGLCLAQGCGTRVWKVRVAGRNILGQVQTMSKDGGQKHLWVCSDFINSSLKRRTGRFRGVLILEFAPKGTCLI